MDTFTILDAIFKITTIVLLATIVRQLKANKPSPFQRRSSQMMRTLSSTVRAHTYVANKRRLRPDDVNFTQQAKRGWTEQYGPKVAAKMSPYHLVTNGLHGLVPTEDITDELINSAPAEAAQQLRKRRDCAVSDQPVGQ